MKRTAKIISPCILGLVLLLALPLPAPGIAEGAAAMADNPSLQGQLEELEGFLLEIDRELSRAIPELSLTQLFNKLREGNVDLSVAGITQGMVQFLFRELLANSMLLGQLIVLAVLAAVLQNMQTAFENATISKLANAVIFLALISLALVSFHRVTSAGKTAIEQMVQFVYALLPVLVTLMASVGSLSTASIIHPVILTALSIISSMTVNIIFPLMYLAAVLTIANQISEQFQVTQLAKLFKDISLGLLGLFLTIFIGILSIQGVAGAVADGVALRTAKFLTGSFVPVVGKAFSDALEAMIGTSLLLKNAVSLIGVAVITCLCLLPAVKILSMALIYRLAAAIIQPFSGGSISNMLESLAGVLFSVFGAVATVGLMFFMVVTIIAGLGNYSVLLR
ncbi:MAG TPA: stage III sporulation protein AE [Clostridia bacterium]|nr:stage III sporulation protein AE [Clostridia bacterium]